MTTTQPAAPPAAGTTDARRASRRRLPETAALLAVLVGLCAFFSVRSEFFLNYDNALNILTAACIIGIIAAPATLLMVAGQVDLSVGSLLTLTGVVMAVVAADHGVAAGVLAAVLTALGVGMLNGMVVTVVGVNSLITTLGTLAVLAGLARVLARGQTIPIDGFSTLGLARPVARIPLPVLLLAAVALAFHLLLRHTVYGRSMYATGSNPVAARLAGIGLRRSLFSGFVLSALCVALAALINVSQLAAASTQAGNGLELSVVTAVVLGGASLAGGRGTIAGTLLGLMVISVLNNGLTLLNVDSFWQDVARGTLLVLAVSFDQLRARLAAR